MCFGGHVWHQIQDEVKKSLSTTVNVSQLIACNLKCTILNAVGVVVFNVASMLCEKITQELLDGLTSCLQSLVSFSTYLQFWFYFRDFFVTVFYADNAQSRILYKKTCTSFLYKILASNSCIKFWCKNLVHETFKHTTCQKRDILTLFYPATVELWETIGLRIVTEKGTL